MMSHRRIDANRRNPQLFTGPRTPQGKAAVRYNGLRHVITARRSGLFAPPPAVAEINMDLKNQSQSPDP